MSEPTITQPGVRGNISITPSGLPEGVQVGVPAQAPSAPDTGVNTESVKLTIDPKPDPSRPEWLDPKFKSIEEQAKAYLDAQKLIGKKEVKSEEPAPGALSPAELQAFTNEFAKEGRLSDATYEALSKKGLPREFVDSYIEGQKARAEGLVGEVWKEAGGKAAYKSVVDWAKENLSYEELVIHNQDVNSGDLRRMASAVKNITARFKAAGQSLPQEEIPNRLSGRPVTGGSNVQPFANSKELLEFQRHPLYKTSEAFRQNVQARLAVTPWA
jgi:hypothetical protein